MKKPLICLTIAGLDPSGGAGIIADIKTFAAFGCFPTAVVASLTFQNTAEVSGASHQTGDVVLKQAEPIFADYEVAAMKTGMLPTADVIAACAGLIKKHSVHNAVIDPVVRSTSGFDLIDDEALSVLVARLFPLSALITPNIPEAERIAKISIQNIDDIHQAARIMHSMGAKNVLIKGGHLRGDNERGLAIDHLFVEGEHFEFEGEYIDTTATHGTGCTLAAAVTANLALGKDLKESVKAAKDFVSEAIRTAPMIGHGHSPINIKPI